MNFSFGRLIAVLRKELREYRRSPFIVGTMAVLPLVFLVEPLITIFRIGPSVGANAVDKAVGCTFLLLLIAPALLPAVIAAYSVVGEREQGTLEPLLTTPLRREELLLGKALGVVVPAVGIAYVLFAVVQICARLFASNAAVVSALGQGPHILAEILFAPLLAGWSIWVGIGISARASDVRVAQQLGTLSSIPTARGRGLGVLQRVHSERHPRGSVRSGPARGRRHSVSHRLGVIRPRATHHWRSRSATVRWWPPGSPARRGATHTAHGRNRRWVTQRSGWSGG